MFLRPHKRSKDGKDHTYWSLVEILPPKCRTAKSKDAISLTREYASIFGAPAMVWYNGWEKIGDPCGPVDIFPPREREESFKETMGILNREGLLALHGD